MKVSELFLTESFGALRELDANDEHFNGDQPKSGPCLISYYKGSYKGKNNDGAILALFLDDDGKIRVSVDTVAHDTKFVKQFDDTKEGYAAAKKYANSLRTKKINLSEAKEEYKTAAQGRKDAKKDLKGGWVSTSDASPKEEKAMRQHLKVSVGATKEYCDGYIAALQELADKEVNEAKENELERLKKALKRTEEDLEHKEEIYSDMEDEDAEREIEELESHIRKLKKQIAAEEKKSKMTEAKMSLDHRERKVPRKDQETYFGKYGELFDPANPAHQDEKDRQDAHKAAHKKFYKRSNYPVIDSEHGKRLYDPDLIDAVKGDYKDFDKMTELDQIIAQLEFISPPPRRGVSVEDEHKAILKRAHALQSKIKRP